MGIQARLSQGVVSIAVATDGIDAFYMTPLDAVIGAACCVHRKQIDCDHRRDVEVTNAWRGLRGCNNFPAARIVRWMVGDYS